MQPIRIRITNVSSIKHADITFPLDNSAYLITGENLDDLGSENNGSGKSSLCDAFAIALFCQTPATSKLESQSLIHEDEEKMEIEVTLSNGEETLEITRSLRKNFSLSIVHNGVSKDFATSTLAQKWLLEYLGFPTNLKAAFRDFCNTIYLSTNELEVLVGSGLSPEDRFVFFSRFFGFDRIDNGILLAKSVVSAYEKKLETAITEKSFLEDQQQNVEELQQQLESLKKQEVEASTTIVVLEQQQEMLSQYTQMLNDIKILEQKSTGLQARLKDTEQRYTLDTDALFMAAQQQQQHEEDLHSLATTIAGFDEVQIMSQKEHLTTLLERNTQELTQQQSIRLTLRQEMERLRSEIQKAHICPSCKTELMVESQETGLFAIRLFNADSLRKALQEHEAKDRGLFQCIEELTGKKTELSQAYQEISKQISLLTGYKAEYQAHLSVFNSLPNLQEESKKITEQYNINKNKLIAEIQAVQQEIQDLEAQLPEEQPDNTIGAQIQLQRNVLSGVLRRQGEIQNNITRASEINSKLIIAQEGIKTLERDVLRSQLILRGFRTVRRWLIDSCRDTLEEATTEKLQQLQSPFLVRYKTIRPEEGKKVSKEQLYIEVVTPWGKTRPIHRLSKGEKARVTAAIALAMRETSLKRGGIRLNFTMVDEMLDNIDNTGVDLAIAMLKELSGMKLITSQKKHLHNRFNNSILVRKQENCSTIHMGGIYATKEANSPTSDAGDQSK